MPAKGTCSSCDVTIGEKELLLKCASCDYQCHAKCEERFSNVKGRIADVTYEQFEKMGYRWFCTNCTPNVSKACSSSFESELVNEIKKLSNRVGNIESLISPSEQKESYASVTKNNEKAIVITCKKRIPNPAMHMAREVNLKIDPVKNKVSGFHVMEKGEKCVLKTRDGDIEKITDEIKKLDKNFDVREMTKRKPRLKIVGCKGSNWESTCSDEKLCEYLKIQNECIGTEATIKIVKKESSKTLDDHAWMILEVCPETHRSILNKGFVFIKFARCRVYNANLVPRCYKCSRLSHYEKNCTSSELCCPKCAGEHKLKDCDSNNLKCINCITANQKLKTKIDVKHAAFDRKCPTLAHRQKTLKSFFEVGNN